MLRVFLAGGRQGSGTWRGLIQGKYFALRFRVGRKGEVVGRAFGTLKEGETEEKDKTLQPLRPSLSSSSSLLHSTTNPTPSTKSTIVNNTHSGNDGKPAASTHQMVNLSVKVNVFNTLLKFGCWIASGLQSASLLAESLHSLVDLCNSFLLWLGVRQARNSNIDARRHPYGYGRVAYFWGLISSVSMLSLGSVAVIAYSSYEFFDASGHSDIVGNAAIWSTAALGISFCTDGYVLVKSLAIELNQSSPDLPLRVRLKNVLKDPIKLGVLLEDAAAVTGVLIAGVGIGLSTFFQAPVFDLLGSAGVGVLMGGIAISLINKNKELLLGQPIDETTEDEIRAFLLEHKSVEQVHEIKHRWEGLECFAFKADLDFSGAYFSDMLLPVYEKAFSEAKTKDELSAVLRNYTEDVTRLIEKEVWSLQRQIQERFPQAMYIELQPHSVNNKPLISSLHVPEYAANEKLDPFVSYHSHSDNTPPSPL